MDQDDLITDNEQCQCCNVPYMNGNDYYGRPFISCRCACWVEGIHDLLDTEFLRAWRDLWTPPAS
jgi:hypothetical protein